MTTNEAYEETIGIVEELRVSGIRVEIKASTHRSDVELVVKYSRPERVAPEKWVQVYFFPVNDEQRSAITEKAMRLGWMGVGFDTGYTGARSGQRDWYLDFSFRYTAQYDSLLEDRRNMVEDLLAGGAFGEPPEDPPA